MVKEKDLVAVSRRRYDERIKVVPKGTYVERVREVVRKVPVAEIHSVDHRVKVPGNIVRVPKHVLVENEILLPRFIDEVVPTVVSQRIEPIIREADPEKDPDCFIDVRCRIVTFKPTHVDVCVPLPVQRQLIAKESVSEYRELQPGELQAERYNALVRSLNPGVEMKHLMQLFQTSPAVAVKIANCDYEGIEDCGAIPCASGPQSAYVEVPEGAPILPVREGGNFPSKVFGGSYEAFPQLPLRRKDAGKAEGPETTNHAYSPYNYRFEASAYFNPAKAAPFRPHHHIGEQPSASRC